MKTSYCSNVFRFEELEKGLRFIAELGYDGTEFWEKHPHPYITLFRDLAESPNVAHHPKTGVGNEYRREMQNAFDGVRLGTASPKEALAAVDKRIQRSLDRELRRLRKRGVIS